MTVLPIVTDNIPALTVPCEPWDFANPPMDPFVLAKDMLDTMYDHDGLGLAANQVGHNWRVFVMRGNPQDFACFNPRIVHSSEETILLEESCLSFPGLIVKVKRPRHVRIRFTAPDGNVVTKQFTGMTARCVQHEIDHLDGKLWYLRGSKYHRDFGQKNRGKYVTKAKSRPSQLAKVSPFDVVQGSTGS